MLRKFILKHSVLYRKTINALFGLKNVQQLIIPYSIYGDFSVNYMAYNEKGQVIKGFTTLREAIKNRGSLGLTVLYDKY